MGLVKNKFWRYVMYVTAALAWVAMMLAVILVSYWFTRSNH